MQMLTLTEAQLFRLLCGLFGTEQVIPLMSVLAICGGELPELDNPSTDKQMHDWARNNKCLFTVIDAQDEPCLVVEFFDGFESSIDLGQEEHQRLVRPFIEARNIKYITISQNELDLLLTSPEEEGFCQLMVAKLEEKEGFSNFDRLE